MIRKQSWVSVARFEPFMEEAGGDEELAWNLYEWNARVAAALWECIHHAEVLLRNAMMDQLSKLHPLSYPWHTDLQGVYETSKKKSSAEYIASPDDVIAGLTLGFWQQFLEAGPKNEHLWRNTLLKAFPHSSGRRDTVRRAIADLRNVRNKCGHQDSLLESDPGIEVQKILTLVGWIDSDARVWLQTIERASEIARERPVQPRRDVLIVPVTSEQGLAMYQNAGAYVCPQERSFAPVQHLGFYCEQEILGNFPFIDAIKVPSLWNKEEAKRLRASNDQDDKRLGQAMGYGLKNGWKSGEQFQVFLLGKKKEDGAAERAGGSPIAHLKRGQGSAFVHRHRYFSMGSLLAAHTTEQLS